LIYPYFLFFDEDIFFDFEKGVFEGFCDVLWNVIVGFDYEFFFLVESEFWCFALVDICENKCTAWLEDAGDFVECFCEVFWVNVDNDKCGDDNVESVVFQVEICHV